MNLNFLISKYKKAIINKFLNRKRGKKLKTCKNCNAFVDDNTTMCPYCGNSEFVSEENISEIHSQFKESEKIDNNTIPYQNPSNNYPPVQPNYSYQPPVSKPDRINAWLVVLSVLIPLAGIIIYFVDKKDHPRNAKTCGKAALAMIIIGVVLSILIVALTGVLVSKGIDAASDAYSYSYDYNIDTFDTEENTLPYVEEEQTDNSTDNTSALGNDKCGYVTLPGDDWKEVENGASSLPEGAIMYESESSGTSLLMSPFGVDVSDFDFKTRKELVDTAFESGIEQMDTMNNQIPLDYENEKTYIRAMYGEINSARVYFIVYTTPSTDDLQCATLTSTDMSYEDFEGFVGDLLSSNSFFNATVQSGSQNSLDQAM